MLVIRGDQRVADIYFTEFNRLFYHYYFRAVMEKRGSKDGLRQGQPVPRRDRPELDQEDTRRARFARSGWRSTRACRDSTDHGCAMNMYALLLSLAIGVGVPAAAHAQQIPPADATETNRPPIIPFLEGTEVYWTLQSGDGDRARFPSALEGDIFPHLVVYQNFTDVIDIDAQQLRGRDRYPRVRDFDSSGTPAVRLRMTRNVSRPVRTPLYMPRGNFQILWARGLKDNVQRAAVTSDVAEALSRLPNVGLWEAHFIVGHHSNGQDGCITTLQERDPPDTGECVPPGIVPDSDTINRVDGSFSTNYFRVGVNYSRNWMTNVVKLQAVRELRFRAERPAPSPRPG